MIIKQTLASALLLLKHSDMEICFRINNDQRLRSEPSPVSGESPVGSAGSYERHFVTIVHGSVRSYHLKIHRLRFKASDGSRNSHAFLMDIMKPHSSYSLL